METSLFNSLQSSTRQHWLLKPQRTLSNASLHPNPRAPVRNYTLQDVMKTRKRYTKLQALMRFPLSLPTSETTAKGTGLGKSAQNKTLFTPTHPNLQDAWPGVGNFHPVLARELEEESRVHFRVGVPQYQFKVGKKLILKTHLQCW